MHWFTATLLYVIIWWTVLFAVLPFWTRPVSTADQASGWRGAPERPLIGRKVLATSLVALILWAGTMLLVTSPWFSLRPGGFFG